MERARNHMTTREQPNHPAVVVVGGGYGGVAVAKALDETASVVLVEPKDAFIHNVAALRALVDPSWLSRIFLPYDGLLTNGRIVRDRVTPSPPRPISWTPNWPTSRSVLHIVR
jgi:flavin-dependent dehydrogenase